MEVGGLLQLEGAFAGDGVVNAAAEEEEVFGLAILVGDAVHGLLPAAELGFDLAGEGGYFGETLLELGGVHGVARDGGHEGEDVEIEQLRGEALGGGDGALAAGDGGEGDGGFALHGGVVDVGDGEGLVADGVGLAQGGEGVGGFAGLRDDHDGGVGEGLLGAVGVFAGVLDVDGNAAEVFDDELGEQAGVAAGAAGGDHDLGVDALEPLEEGAALVGAELAAGYISVYRSIEGSGLFEDLAEHPVSEGGGFGRCGHGGAFLSKLII